ncbi:NAD(P)-dependent dehydrogenase (short-subunit alcohol dehydrogenase family) [Nonomuraea thailandensis]|uniref:NAD(P)-dependent dehydrogenase (Short-subunit alcohol dehydrogenase family) n=1 Tax=Nonomuraea thailandensis TaxID=1188745 RepID=A0A9X2GU73_9ACTN|nr:SDR family oxidoreductase [Nonomuraea thailandensis]MCP2363827.1 NAD(P)-dependent dehydrogenase (short-subunit alcohol dehydrogenase family) [Nonomuraea thailandensis]
MAGTVAVVTGAARGIGRGIALVLGEAGATVYVTDRESRERRHSELPGTVEDTAEQVSERGGSGVPVRVDHGDDRAVEALFARVREERAGLDLLVANAFAGNALPFRGGPFWTLPLGHWHNMIDLGLRSHLVSALHAAPLLIERGGLIVLTGYADPDAEVIAGHLFYDLAMTGVSRLARSLAHDLRPHGVTALALSPGFTRTEAILAELGEDVTEGDSVEVPGRAVRALLEDPDVGRHAGRTLSVAELAGEYGFPR